MMGMKLRLMSAKSKNVYPLIAVRRTGVNCTTLIKQNAVYDQLADNWNDANRDMTHAKLKVQLLLRWNLSSVYWSMQSTRRALRENSHCRNRVGIRSNAQRRDLSRVEPLWATQEHYQTVL